MRDADQKKLDEILNKYNGAEGFLIQLLLDLQSEFNWIPREAVSELSERLKIPTLASCSSIVLKKLSGLEGWMMLYCL